MKNNETIPEKKKLTLDYIKKMDAYWRATNYLAIAQQYLWDNILLRKPLENKHVKKRIVAPWGTVPGQNFIYVHLNRVIKRYDLDMILLSGPGHGGHFWTANTYLDGSFSQFYPDITQDNKGLQKFCKQFCFPNGMSSHVAADMPGSIHEGGELGYSIAHATGAILDNPNLIATVIVGDGEAETGPLATSWHSNKFINPITDGAILPILHLNGFKVANPTVLSRISKQELSQLFMGYGWKPYFVEGDDPMQMHKLMATTLNKVIEEIKTIQNNARSKNNSHRPIWPMIILRTPKGWTEPKEVDGIRMEGTHNAYHIPISMTKPHHIKLLEKWLKSYKPEELFDENGKLIESLQELAPKGNARIGCNKNANGGLLLKDLILPDIDNYAVNVKKHGETKSQDTSILGIFLRDIIKKNPNNFRIFSPDELVSNKMTAVYEVSNNVFNATVYENDDYVAHSGRIMDSYLSEHMCEGWLEGYLLTGRHGIFSSYAAFIRVVDSMISQHLKWLKASKEISWRKDISSLNLVLTSHAWQQDHNGYSHQDPGLLDHLANKKGDFVRLYLPPDANCLLCVYDHCARTKNYVNAIVSSKQPSPQWLNIQDAKNHCKKGYGIWDWASTTTKEPDIVLACAGDVITMETLAASQILRENLPNLKLRFVNVVDIMCLRSPSVHPHGMSNEEYDKIFTIDKPIVFNYHGYPSLIEEFTWARTNRNLTVHGYIEEGKISTPFDIRVQNKTDRFNLVKTVLSKLPQTKKVIELNNKMDEMLAKHTSYINKYGIDMPEILNWQWKDKDKSKKTKK